MTTQRKQLLKRFLHDSEVFGAFKKCTDKLLNIGIELNFFISETSLDEASYLSTNWLYEKNVIKEKNLKKR